MSLFEIELNKDFKILNSNIFLKEDEFKKFYKKNNLNDRDNDDISNYLEESLLFKVHHDSFVMSNYRYEIDELIDIIKKNLYISNENSNEEILYPEWLLFYIAIKKEQVPFVNEKDFKKYLELFKYIAEIRYKKYIIRNVKNYISFSQYKEAANIKSILHKNLLEFLNNSQLDEKLLFEYLDYIFWFHYELKENEKYKLMWNLETYIIETVNLLVDKKIKVEDIYTKIAKNMRGTYSVLHDIHLHKPLYIEESEHYFQGYLSKINTVFKSNITIDSFMNTFITNSKYEDILFSYIELIKRFNANTISEHVMSAMIKGIVLGIEEILIDSLRIKPTELIDAIQSKEFIENKRSRTNLNKLLERTKMPKNDFNNKIFFDTLNKFIEEEIDTFEKYVVIFHRTRNYLAHNNINMNKFFWGEDGQKIIISGVIDSVILILYRIEMMKNELLLKGLKNES